MIAADNWYDEDWFDLESPPDVLTEPQEPEDNG